MLVTKLPPVIYKSTHLVRGMGLGQAKAGFGHRVGGQGGQKGCGVGIVLANVLSEFKHLIGA